MSIQHVIIGGGPAATNAVETIRQLDGGASRITLISDEPAHSRMALPYWLAGKISQEHTHTGSADYFQKLKTETLIGESVSRIDVPGKAVLLRGGRQVPFDNLLVATGSSPLMPKIPGYDLPGVQPLWSLAHTQSALASMAGIARPRVVLVGAGFIGFIVLNAMFKRGWQMAVVERESQVLPRMLDGAAAGMLGTWLAGRQVDVHTGTTVQAISAAAGGEKSVELSNGQKLAADLVILATGIRPNLDLLAGSGILADQGVLVNDRMQSSVPFIYAAGDVAQGPVLFHDRPAIHAIQPTAVDHGRVAGANMAGETVHYPGSLLMNVVDCCGLQCASFGHWDDPEAEAMTIAHPAGAIYRKLLWRDDLLVGAIFTGRANDLGMLTDVGMVKGILQTQTRFGAWKKFLSENPFDIRRAYIALEVAQKLAGKTLLGRPARARQYQYGGVPTTPAVGPAHALYVGTKPR